MNSKKNTIPGERWAWIRGRGSFSSGEDRALKKDDHDFPESRIPVEEFSFLEKEANGLSGEAASCKIARVIFWRMSISGGVGRSLWNPLGSF